MNMRMMRQEGVSCKPHKTCWRLRITITDVIFYSCGKLHPYAQITSNFYTIALFIVVDLHIIPILNMQEYSRSISALLFTTPKTMEIFRKPCHALFHIVHTTPHKNLNLYFKIHLLLNTIRGSCTTLCNGMRWPSYHRQHYLKEIAATTLDIIMKYIQYIIYLQNYYTLITNLMH